MKILLMSDLHLDHYRKDVNQFINSLALTKINADILILAGDILQLDQFDYQNKISKLCDNFEDIIYVPGNHEYYGSTVEDATNKLVKLQSKIKNLQIGISELNHIITIKKQKFIAGTMWYRYDEMNEYYERFMNDYFYIGGFNPWVYHKNAVFLNILRKNCDNGSVIVTHHAPSSKSTLKRFEDSNLNRFYICDVEDIILDKQPKLWIHGHTHCKFDYNIGNTRIVTNPSGYPSERDCRINFNKGFVIEI